MSAPVWVLSVDLQAKTATFSTGLRDAARTARESFQDIGNSAKASGRQVSESTTDVRHSLGLMDNAIRGNHAAAMVDFIRLNQQSSIVMAALPWAATVGGVLLLAGGIVALVKHFQELHAAEEKLGNDQTRLGTTINDVFNGLDIKILEAQKQADELTNNHLAALHIQLQLINKQSMSDLKQAFEEVSKTVDGTFGKLKASWYQFGSGSVGAQHALEQFKTQYESLISQGKDKDASGLLQGTLAQAQKILTLQQQSQAFKATGNTSSDDAAYTKTANAHAELQKAGVGYTEKEVQAQQALVSALTAQVGIEERVATLKKLEGQNASTEVGNQAAAQRAEAARQSADQMAKMGQAAIAADRARADAQLTITRASLEQRLISELDFASREKDLQEAANQAQIQALDKSGKDYANQLKNLNDKAVEIQGQYDAQVAELKSKSLVEIYNRDLENLRTNEQEKIEATRQASAARLAAVDAAIREEESKGLQETEFYRSLLKERVEVVRSMSEEEGKATAAAGKEAAENDTKMGELKVAALKQYFATRDSSMRANLDREVQEQTQLANMEYQIKLQAFQREAAALDANGADYLNKLKTLQDKEKQLVQQHENEITAIKERAEEQRNRSIESAETRFQESIAKGLTQVLMGHQSFAQMMNSLGNQVVSGLIQNAIMSMLAADMTKERDAAFAARKAFMAGMQFPFPANIIAAPVMAAGAFASVMAFAQGGEVPGIGVGDVVPAKMEPGETVVSKRLTDMVKRTNAPDGSDGGATHHHLHYRPTFHVQTIDKSGVKDMLDKHTDEFTKHYTNHVRKQNRG